MSTVIGEECDLSQNLDFGIFEYSNPDLRIRIE